MTLYRSIVNSGRSNNPPVKHQQRPTKKPKTIKPELRDKSKYNHVISTTESTAPDDTDQYLGKVPYNPEGSRLFLYDSNGTSDSFWDSSIIGVDDEVSASVFLQCVDSNPRDTLQPYRRKIFPCTKPRNPPPAVGDVKTQQTDGKASIRPDVSVDTELHAHEDMCQHKQCDQNTGKEVDVTLKTLSMLDDTVFLDDTPGNESSMTIDLQALKEEVDRANDLSTARLELLERPSLIPSQRKFSMELKCNSQITETIVENKISHRTSEFVAQMSASLSSAPSYHQGIIPEVGPLALNMSNSGVERKNSHKTIWQRLFRRSSKSASKDSEELSKINSKSRTFGSTSPSLEVTTQKTLNTFKSHSNNTRNAKQDARYNPPSPFEVAKAQRSGLKEEIVPMASKGNQTDFRTKKRKFSKANRMHASSESPHLVQWQSLSKEGSLFSVNPKEGNRQNSKELATIKSGNLEQNTSKVISVEVSNSSIASADSDLVCFVQVAKTISVENSPPKSAKKAYEEKEAYNTQKTILPTSCVKEGEGVREGCTKRAESRRTNLEIKAPCVSAISPPTNCVDTTDEDDPFASDHFSSVFSAKDSLDLCTWVEKPTHFKISEDKTISRKSEPVTAAGSIAPFPLEETRIPEKLHPKDSLDMYVLGDVDPVEKKPFKNEVKFLLRRKKTKLVQEKKEVPAIDCPQLLLQPQQQQLQQNMDFASAIEELAAQFQQLKRQNSSVVESRAFSGENKWGEGEDGNGTEYGFYNENEDSVFLDQNRPASEPPPEIVPNSHGQESVINEELMSFPQVRVFITSPDSITHTPVEESSHNSPTIEQTSSPTDAPPQLVIISPYSTDGSNHPSVVGPVPTFPMNEANLGAFYCVLPNQSDKQNQVPNSSPDLAFHSLQYGSVMHPAGVRIPTFPIVTEPHLHSLEVPQQVVFLNPMEMSPSSPDPNINELPSIQMQDPPTSDFISPVIQFESQNFRPIQDSNYAASGEDSLEYILPENCNKFQEVLANSGQNLLECIQSELITNNQKNTEISNRSLKFGEVVPCICTLNPSSNLISPNPSALIMEQGLIGDKQEKMFRSENTISGEAATQRSNLEKTKATHPTLTHSYSLENNRHSDDPEIRTKDLKHNILTTNLSYGQALPLFALNTTMSTTTASADLHFPPDTAFISDNQVRKAGECSRQASSPSEKGSCTEIEVIGIDDEANTSEGERCKVGQSAVLIEKISDSLVSFLELHSTTRHSLCDTSTKKEIPDQEDFNFVSSMTQNIRCNRKADYEVSISVSGNSQTDLKVRLGSVTLTQEGQYEDRSVATPPQRESSRCGNTGEVEQLRSAEEDTLWVPSSKSIIDSEVQSETLKINASTISGGDFEEPVVSSSGPKLCQEQNNPPDKNLDGNEYSPVSETEVLEIPLNVATNRNSCYFLNRDGLSLSTDSKQRETGEYSDVSGFQNVMVTSKVSPAAAPSSTFQALNVEVKANPAWLCQGMFVRAVKTRNEGGYMEKRSRTGENESISSGPFIFHEEIRNQSIPSIKINHSDEVDSRKTKDGRFILDCSMDVLQPSKVKREESDVIDHLGFISIEDQNGPIQGPTTRTLRRDSNFIQRESNIPLRTYFRSTLQTTLDCSGNGAHTMNSQDLAAKIENVGRQNDVKLNEQIQVLENNGPVEEIRPKPRKLVNLPASSTPDSSRKQKLSPTSAQEMPALIFVPGTRLPTELMKLYDSKTDHPSGWCIMPLPVYRTQHALYAAYAQNFSGFKV
ncbi:hypothetical protein EGR_04547 [Echinococcus granulosus]|uniref:Uncharacterized protein n=1 Tax=Echinococcus granulosus TaxID=6210 RepID=U6J2L3_ECHGR|nr:hypothetical protein EGR_04547 [Echinococcus granulosus]EUB60528.1 hypothetical protein EGR_04547 [Echinococcus granulosus]CDS18244.1 hypothetical protein EgrG_000600300 [Echinococcus granulosus]